LVLTLLNSVLEHLLVCRFTFIAVNKPVYDMELIHIPRIIPTCVKHELSLLGLKKAPLGYVNPVHTHILCYEVSF